jgi:D-alanine-D-alanine ligase-like ATP-grasp enzyme
LSSEIGDQAERQKQGVAAAVDRLGLPLMMKPPHEGSTLGIVKATHKEDILVTNVASMVGLLNVVVAVMKTK